MTPSTGSTRSTRSRSPPPNPRPRPGARSSAVSQKPLNILVLASYFKGDRFMRQAARRGARLFLLTVAKRLNEAWPREVLADVFAQQDDSPLSHTLNTVSYLARSIKFDRIVPMDDYDVETAASLREHLRIPGMGDTTARHFRDKLAMRVKAQEEGIPVPDFVHVLNYDELREYMARVPPPWMLKPRSQASATGIRKIRDPDQLWKELERLGDQQSYFLLERFVPGDIYHCDSIISEKKVAFAEVHRCGTPPFDVAHGGGIFTTHTVERGSSDEKELRKLNEQVLTRLNLVRGVSHTEYIKGKDGKFYFMETSARVGGAHISDVVEAATGVNLWEEWANIEIDKGQVPYELPKNVRRDYAGAAVTLARQAWPDYSAYTDPEIVMQVKKEHHAGIILKSTDCKRIEKLMGEYGERFKKDFMATAPAPEKPND
ncbi:MAG: ATP-grasp domain-containing protein [Deltaproteobacteria bacterium]|nr:ATP-grasp domain-containing protein [Deltaproteobacteria bacterium]